MIDSFANVVMMEDTTITACYTKHDKIGKIRYVLSFFFISFEKE